MNAAIEMQSFFFELFFVGYVTGHVTRATVVFNAKLGVKFLLTLEAYRLKERKIDRINRLPKEKELTSS